MTSLRLLQSMKKIGPILLAVFCLSLAPSRIAAQSDDPSEVFLKAYMTSQQGEKLEHDNQLQAALAKFRFAGSLLEELRKTHSDWQPAIVDYRGRKIGENIVRVQGKLGTQKDLAATLERRRLRRRVESTRRCRRNLVRPSRMSRSRPPLRRWSRSRPPAPASEPSASVASDKRDQRGDEKIAGQSRSTPGGAGKIAQPI